MSSFPEHWGDPPQVQAANITELPGGYGYGSSSMAGWIRKKMAEDAGVLPGEGDCERIWRETGGLSTVDGSAWLTPRMARAAAVLQAKWDEEDQGVEQKSE